MRNGTSVYTSALVLTTLVAGVMGASRSRAQEPMFSGGDAYERFMGRWSRALAAAFTGFAGVRVGETILDVGSGTGALAEAVAASNASARVIGIDPAASYVAFAQARHGSARVQFEVGDAQRLRFPDGHFDRTLSLLVLNFIPDRSRALREMIRVTRAGGTVASAVWDYGDGMEMLRVFWDETGALDPSAAAHDERHMPLSRAGELVAFWREHGLGQVSGQAIEISMRFTSFDDYWQPFLEKQGPAGDYLATLAPDARARLRERLRLRLLGHGRDRPIDLRARAWAVRGTVSP